MFFLKQDKARSNLLLEREAEIKRKAKEKEEIKFKKQIEATHNIALQAIKKEINIEELIRKEEEERQSREEKELFRTIEEEKKKKECLIKAIKERKLENQYNTKEKEALQHMEKIKKEASEEIAKRRNELKLQIENTRKAAERKKNKLKQQLTTIRYEMAQEMNKIYKKGDMNKCIEASKSEENRKTYCSSSFIEDYSAYSDCNEGNDFCTICCDFEYGEFYLDMREGCYKACNNATEKSAS